MNQGCGRLYLVSTPIGNLDDMTFRAVETLKTADIIAAEDTRRTSILLKHYGISKPMISFFEHNKLKRVDVLLKRILSGESVALVSDAGTPAVSDPGYSIVRAAVDSGIRIIPVPGPSAALSALVVSGKPTDRFLFEGFLPVKRGKKIKRLEEIRDLGITTIVYESCHRIIKTLNDIESVMGDAEVVVARELTKKFEEVKRCGAREMIEYFSDNRPRGEFVIVL